MSLPRRSIIHIGGTREQIKQRRLKTIRGRKVKVQGQKKAIVTLKKGQNIDLTTGI